MSDGPSESFEPPLAALGELRAERGLRFEFLAIGGGALQLLGLIVRPTRDIDVLAQVDETGLVPIEALPAPFRRSGRGGLVLHLANRRDRIFFKLYAAADQGPRSKHFEDLRRLEATDDELRAAAAWARTHDPSEGFRNELRRALRDLGVIDGDV